MHAARSYSCRILHEYDRAGDLGVRGKIGLFTWGDKDTSKVWKDWSLRAGNINTCGVGFWKLVNEAELSYIYVREGMGSLRAEGLQGCEGVRLLYASGGVSIWLIERPASAGDL